MAAKKARASNPQPRQVAVKNDAQAPRSAVLAPPEVELPEPAQRSGRRARIAAVGAIALVGIAIALAIAMQSGGKSHAGTGSALPSGDQTVSVQRRTLTEHAQVDGTLGYGSTLELFDRITGTFTWLPSVGSVIQRGGTLFKINQLPIVLMYGSVPAYRTLKQGVSDGEDVTQLNENLIALGYDPYGAITSHESFSAGTASAVRRWQEAEGLPQTGVVELGRVIFAPSARRVTAVKPALGQDPPGGEGSGANEPSKKEPSQSKTPSKGPSKGTPSSQEPSSAGSGTPVLTTTSTQQIVQLQLEADKQQLARVGASAPVTLPSGRTVGAHITSVGTVASQGGGGGGATIAVTLALERRVPRLDAAPVTVELVKERRPNVLTIPATALIATAGGGYAVEALEGRRRVELAVTPGMFADGYVQIEGEGVHEGLTITQPAE